MSLNKRGEGDICNTDINDQEPSFTDKAIHSLTDLGFTYLKPLGSGTFGDVFLMKDRNEKKHAVKIIKPENVSYGELHIWPFLCHTNILPLTKQINLPSVPAIAFQMPSMPDSYEGLIQNKLFSINSDAIGHTVSFLKDILDGLLYLHQNGLCHMDIKTNNILISGEGRAFLCDFTFLTKCDKPIKSYGTPLHLRPPEACISKGSRIPVHGPSFEAWTMGMLAMNALTRHLSWILPRKPESWTQVTYPALSKYLQADFFRHRVRWAFPECKVSDEEIKVMRNFVLMFLTRRPEDRPTMELAKKHAFLGEGDYLPPVDDLWQTSDCIKPAEYSECPTDLMNEQTVIKNRTHDINKNRDQPKYLTVPIIKNGTQVVQKSAEHKDLAVKNIRNPPGNNEAKVVPKTEDYLKDLGSAEKNFLTASKIPNMTIKKKTRIAPVPKPKPRPKKDPVPALKPPERGSSIFSVGDYYRAPNEKEKLLPTTKKKGIRGAFKWVKKKVQYLKIGIL